MYAASVADPNAFWAEHGKRIDWIKPFSKVKNTTFEYPDVSIKWYEDGVLNVCANCVDRHLETKGNQTAIIWESDEPGGDEHITYKKLHEHVSKLANVIKSLGVTKGDRVILYMPMIPEAAYAMLACTRIGAIHSVVFGGFSPDALASRISRGASAPRGARQKAARSLANRFGKPPISPAPPTANRSGNTRSSPVKIDRSGKVWASITPLSLSPVESFTPAIRLPWRSIRRPISPGVTGTRLRSGM